MRGAQYHLEALEAAGAIERRPGLARSLRVLQPPPSAQADLPLKPRFPTAPCGCRCSGRSQPARHRRGHRLRTGTDPRPRAVLAGAGLPAEGEGRFDARRGIFDGDLIGVHRTPTARSGQIVVARLDDEITVKLLKTGGERIRLLPRNPDYAPIEVQPGQDFAIEGLYCGLVRPNK